MITTEKEVSKMFIYIYNQPALSGYMRKEYQPSGYLRNGYSTSYLSTKGLYEPRNRYHKNGYDANSRDLYKSNGHVRNGYHRYGYDTESNWYLKHGYIKSYKSMYDLPVCSAYKGWDNYSSR